MSNETIPKTNIGKDGGKKWNDNNKSAVVLHENDVD